MLIGLKKEDSVSRARNYAGNAAEGSRDLLHMITFLTNCIRHSEVAIVTLLLFNRSYLTFAHFFFLKSDAVLQVPHTLLLTMEG